MVISQTKSRFIFTLSLILTLVHAGMVIAQDATEEATNPSLAQAYRNAALFAGPSETYPQLGILPPGLRVEIVERNDIGNWLRVRSPGASRVDGWVMTGYLTLHEDLTFSTVTINMDLDDADVSGIVDARVASLYDAPVISDVSPTMQLIYRRGQALGNNSSSVTKIGDSVTADPIYLAPMIRDDNVLGPYDYLQSTLDYFGPDVVQISIAARISLTTYSVFDPMLADGALCQRNETPLDCEYRVRKPSVSFIMFGANDVRHIDVDRFDEQMRQIVEQTLSHGIIPVLSTFSYDPNAGYWDQALDFNLAVVDIADDYDIPLINLWAAARALPQYGLDGDDVHMAHSGFRQLKYDTGHESWYGVSLRNLLSLRMLEEIRSTLGMK